MMISCALLLAAGMQSCKKDDKKNNSSGNPPSTTTDNFQVTVNGVNYDPSTIDVQEVGGVIACNATVNSTTNFAIYTDDLIQPGTYPIDGNTQFDVIHSDDNNATFYASTAGTVTIITHDTVANTMSGTFSCTLTRSSPAGTKTATNGVFSFSY